MAQPLGAGENTLQHTRLHLVPVTNVSDTMDSSGCTSWLSLATTQGTFPRMVGAGAEVNSKRKKRSQVSKQAVAIAL